MKKKLLAVATLILAICLCLTISVKAEASTKVAKIGNTEYERLDAALAAVKNNETIVLLQDLEIPKEGGDNGHIKKNGNPVNFTLDLGGFTITSKGDGKDAIVLEDESTVTIKNGTIENEGEDCAILIQKGTVILKDNITLSNKEGAKYGTVQVGYKSGNTSGHLKIEDGAKINGGVTVSQSSSVEMTGGEIVNPKGFAISGNGSNSGNTTITVKGGTLESKNSAAIYHPQQGILNVSGGTLKGEFGIVARRGTVNVTGGKITATGTGTDSVGDATEGESKVQLPAGTAIVLDNKSTGYGTDDVKARVTGGEFEASNDTAIVSLEDTDHSDFEILGGAYNKAFDQEYINAEKAEVKIGDKYYVGEDATKAVTEAIKDEKAVIEVLKGDVTIKGAVPGVTVVNSGNGDVTVNGMDVTTEKVVVPAAEDEEEQDDTPKMGTVNVFTVAGAILVVSALGVVVLNKRK